MSHHAGQGRTRSSALVRSAYSRNTRSRYDMALRGFLEWITDHNHDAHDFDEIDALLTEYLDDLYLRGGGKQAAINTVFGLIMHIPALRTRLPTARLALRGWEKLRPSESYPPLTWELTVVIAVQMLRAGRRPEAVATVLAFDCYLRISEMVALRVGDVVDSGDHRLGAVYRGVACRLRYTKTGPNQWVEVEDAAVQTLLLGLKRGSRRDKIFGFTAGSYRSLFKRVCAGLGLSSGYVPHSLRHGGATRDFLSGRPLEDILVRGRWASTKSAGATSKAAGPCCWPRRCLLPSRRSAASWPRICLLLFRLRSEPHLVVSGHSAETMSLGRVNSSFSIN